MNTYVKYSPNVYVAKCEEQHEKGDIINVTTKYGKENECQVWNYLGQKNGFYFYSITRTDGYNCQQRAQKIADRYQESSEKASMQSSAMFDKSMNAVKGIPFGQPILTDHYSAKGHRNAIDRSWNALGKSVALSEKAERCQDKAEYWERKAEQINLSMPESIKYYKDQLEKAEAYHAKLKSGVLPRDHAYSLTYAKKAVNEMRDNYEKALKLWGDNDQ